MQGEDNLSGSLMLWTVSVPLINMEEKTTLPQAITIAGCPTSFANKPDKPNPSTAICTDSRLFFCWFISCIPPEV